MVVLYFVVDEALGLAIALVLTALALTVTGLATGLALVLTIGLIVLASRAVKLVLDIKPALKTINKLKNIFFIISNGFVAQIRFADL